MKAGRAGSKRWIFSSVLALAMGAAPWARAERTPVRSVPSPAILPDGTRVAYAKFSVSGSGVEAAPDLPGNAVVDAVLALNSEHRARIGVVRTEVSAGCEACHDGGTV